MRYLTHPGGGGGGGGGLPTIKSLFGCQHIELQNFKSEHTGSPGRSAGEGKNGGGEGGKGGANSQTPVCLSVQEITDLLQA